MSADAEAFQLPAGLDARLVETTGRGAAGWLELLDARGGRELDHTALAKLAYEELSATDSAELGTENLGWWAQTVAVTYERLTGKRSFGQTCNGDFAVSVSKTYPGDLDAALAAFSSMMDDYLAGTVGQIDGVDTTSEPRISASEKWRYWKIALDDGSRVDVSIGIKGPEKSSIGIQHSGLESADDRERWRPVWKARVAEL